MGYALLYESMLDSVLCARDRFLNKEKGIMAPSQTQMMFGLCTADEIFKERVAFWGDIYGAYPVFVPKVETHCVPRVRLVCHVY